MLFALLALGHFFAAALFVVGIDWLMLIPWRRSAGAHWTERARLLWPVRRTNGLLLFLVPVAAGALQASLFLQIPLGYLFAALTGVPGTLLGMWPMAHRVSPEVTFAGWMRHCGAAFFIRFLSLVVVLVAGVCMPNRFNEMALAWTVAVLAIKLWLIWGGIPWLLRITGLVVAAPARLARVVQATAAQMGLPEPRVGLLRGYGVNALALPVSQILLVTDRALDALDDEELAAICAHEFAHLNEPPRVVGGLILGAFTLVPIIFFNPALGTWGVTGYFGICAVIFVCARLSAAFRRRMERRADSVATVHQGPSPGTYARALERIYQLNHVPAVLRGSLTHPNLYDRLVAAGVTPDYPRPAPPKFSWSFVVTFLLLFVASFCVGSRVATRMEKGGQRTIDVEHTLDQPPAVDEATRESRE